jgi:peptidoglycan L-alanyl-D-glutamate endopeptidase CwlK
MGLTAIDLERLGTCDHRLASVVRRVATMLPLRVIEGHRNEHAQNAAFDAKKTQLRWPAGKHNSFPSLAVDIVPLPIDWNDREAFCYLAGHMLMAAQTMGYEVRWGGDWNRDHNLKDNKFDDLVHYELLLSPNKVGWA